MISYISGTAKKIISGIAIVAAHDVGYEIHLHDRDLLTIKEDDHIEVWVVTVMNESSIRLFGFLDFAEREMFQLLTSVSGVGPKTALAILGSTTPDTIRSAIIEGDEKVFRNVSGVGPKSAQRLVLELRDKVGTSTAIKKGSVKQQFTDRDIVLSALTNLGYTRHEIDQLIEDIDPELGAEEMITTFIKLHGQR